jgi:5'-3' exonuclease
MADEHLLLVDASGFAFRAYYSWNPQYRPSDGQPVGAVLGFMAMMYRMLGRAENDKPTHAVAAFDPEGPTWRHKIFPGYKSNRDPARRVELDKQFHYMRHAAETLGLHPVEVDGYEADDVIATLADRAMAAGIRTTIVSSDKDFGQLFVEGKIGIVDPMQRRRVTEEDIRKKFGVTPDLVPDVQALAGDAVDGIPGITGVGLEKAAGLIRRFGSLKGVLRNADECRWPSIRRALKSPSNKANLYLKLTTLVRDVPVPFKLEDLRAMPIMESHLRAILQSLEASHKFDILFSSEQKLVRFYPHDEYPLEWWGNQMIVPGGIMPEDPQCGFFKRRLDRQGPWVGARIWRTPEKDLETDEPTGRDVMRCEVNGKPRDPVIEWPRLFNYPCREDDFRFEIADADHARRYRPDDPKADPTKPIDFNKVKAPHCPPSTKTTRS